MQFIGATLSCNSSHSEGTCAGKQTDVTKIVSIVRIGVKFISVSSSHKLLSLYTNEMKGSNQFYKGK